MADTLSDETIERPWIDLSRYHSPLSRKNKAARLVWDVVWALLFRPSPRVGLGFAWRRFLLRLFGARIGRGASVYPSCRIWAPWNLEMGDFSSLSHNVDCYSVDRICIGQHAAVSQYSFLCTASHDIADPHLRLMTSPILIGDRAWVCAGVFVGPGIVLHEGAVAAARSVVVKDVGPWTVVGGNPAKVIKRRNLRGIPLT